MYSAFNNLVFFILVTDSFCVWKSYVLFGEMALWIQDNFLLWNIHFIALLSLNTLIVLVLLWLF